eukprot:993887-Alexandrium_andersonii.AAC.1
MVTSPAGLARTGRHASSPRRSGRPNIACWRLARASREAATAREAPRAWIAPVACALRKAPAARPLNRS